MTNGARLGEDARRSIIDRASPDGIVTILFTDIVESTRFRQRFGDERAQERFRQHYQIIRTEIEKHGGFEVKTQGDGFMVAFSDVAAALACAIAIQEAVATDNEEHPKERLDVRIGLNCGQAIQEGEDFFGGAVVVAARIGALAKGGQILVSETVRGLARLQPEIRYIRYGRRRLKGLTGRYNIWAVPWGADATAGVGIWQRPASRLAAVLFALFVFAGGIAGGLMLSRAGGGTSGPEFEAFTLQISTQTAGELATGDCSGEDLVVRTAYQGTATGDISGRVVGSGETTLYAAEGCQSGAADETFTLTDADGNTLSWTQLGPGSITAGSRDDPAATSFTPAVDVTGGTGIYAGASGEGTCTILGVVEFDRNNALTGNAEAECQYELTFSDSEEDGS